MLPSPINPLRLFCTTWIALIGTFGLAAELPAAETLRISELMAAKQSTLADQDGEFSDWIEIQNPTPAPLSLGGWYLTDTVGALTKWRFPNTNVAAYGFLIVFASNKDRSAPGAELHTNFKLNEAGEYLALVRPDGVTVASEYAPQFPVQVPNVSYGIPSRLLVTNLISAGASARVLVPLSGNLGSLWLEPAFDDAAWPSQVTGIGYETDPLAQPGFTQALLTDSVRDFSGVQGQNSWFYGSWAKPLDAGHPYSPDEFVAFPIEFWRGNPGGWDASPAGPPLTQLTATGGQPNGANNGEAAWAIRRYLSPSDGAVQISGTLAHPGDACGDGTIARILVDGQEVLQRTVFHTSIGYSVIASVKAGSRVDFILESGGVDDNCETTSFTAVIRTADPATSVIADTIADWSLSGTQGERNWFYGYYNKTADLFSGYQTTNFTAFPRDDGPPGEANFWTGFDWDWTQTGPPLDQIGQIFSHPNGANNGAEHWVIRRWISKVSGTLIVDWHLAKQNTTAGGGNGVTGRVFQKGASKDSISIAGNDAVGVTRTVVLRNVVAGDPIDFALDPKGLTSATDDGSDGSYLNATISGYANLSDDIASDIETSLHSINSTVYLRIPFTVADPSAFSFLTLRMKYDDGFVAYLNGIEVARRNAPLSPAWNSAAPASRSDADAERFEELDLTSRRDLLRVGENVLAVHGLNVSAGDSDFLLLPELVASGFVADLSSPRYFTSPTPGAINGFGNLKLGPLVLDVKHSPAVPRDDEDLIVTARLSPTFNPVASATLFYSVMFGAEKSLPMFDDGQHGDGAAGDNVFGAIIPSTVSTNGQMIRYYLVANDTMGNVSRLPQFLSPTASPKYFGTVVEDPTLKTALPVLYWFIQNPSGANESAGARCSIFFNGEFYDNVNANVHGQSSIGFAKHSFDFNLNSGFKLRWSDSAPRVSDFNLLTTYPDKAIMRNMLAYETYRDAGTPYHYVFPVRVQQNGAFFSIAHFVENGDNEYLRRLGLDENGALYKMYNTLDSASGEKKTRKNEGMGDLQVLINGCNKTGVAKAQYLFDNINIPETVNYLAAMTITGDTDCCHKNYYLYRDTEGTGEWQMTPWDQDLSFGRVWNGSQTYWDEVLHPDTALYVGDNNTLVSAMFTTPAIKQMYLRRLRTLMDELMEPPSTPSLLGHYERRIDELAGQMGPDAVNDLAKWKTFGQGSEFSACCVQTLTQAVNRLKFEYLPARRKYLFETQSGGVGKEIPLSQPDNLFLTLGALEFNPASGNQAEEYLQVLNTNRVALDISGWKVTGGITHTFHAGTVMPSNSVLYVSPDVNAFRARTTGPRGGQALFVQGNYQGQLSARGGSLQLVDRGGRVVSSNSYAGAPSLAQQFLRITEIMYHPPPVAVGGPYTAEDFEYVELKNIGSVVLDLSGVHFTNGIAFNFSGSSVTSLPGSQTVLVVRNRAAFVSRYGAGFNVAGEYLGSLNNSGESLRLDDAVGEKILDFRYENSWYRATDGLGFSLVIVQEQAPWESWGEKARWRPSGQEKGSPGDSDPALVSVAAIRINEVLSHTESSGEKDAIELYNPTLSPVNLEGWFLSDDFGQPKKYRIPAGVVIGALGYLVLDESHFNTRPGVAPSFSLSALGDEAYLFSGDAKTNLTGYLHGYKFGAAENGVTFGPYVTSVGQEEFVAQREATLGRANAGPKVGPIVISEIQYHPPDLGNGVDNALDEYVELYNLGASSVSLFDPLHATNTWQLRGAVEFSFGTNQILLPKSYLVVVSFNPTNAGPLAAFRSRYGLAEAVEVVGPLGGPLFNGGGSVELDKPDSPVGAVVPYVLVDRVEYGDVEPWPRAADGAGASLQRVEAGGYGNDPANWRAALPSPGRAYPGGVAPVITQGPVSRTAVAFSDAPFTVGVEGAAPFRYQWRWNGTNLNGATEATLTLNRVLPGVAGNYSVVVTGPGGTVESTNAALRVVIPAIITSQPQSLLARAGTNVTFSVAASSGSPIVYQWQFKGVDILNANAASITIPNAQPANEGPYTVRLTDSVGSITSDPALLTVVFSPVITRDPISQVAVAGDTVVFSVAATGTQPLGYKWKKGTATVTPASLQGKPTLTLTNVQLAQAGAYSVLITNSANLAGVASTSAVLMVLADTDGDHMPDDWERSFGFNPDDPTDGNVDSDGDTMTNWQEYIAGTDPTNALSYLKVDQVTLGVGGTFIEFSAISNKTYTVQFKESLSAGRWTRLADVANRPTNWVARVPDPYPPAERRLYRLVTPQLPPSESSGPAIPASP